MPALAALDRVLRTRVFYACVFVACLVPGVLVAWHFYDAVTTGNIEVLGADPVKETLHRTGFYALTLVLCALAVTPLRRFLGLNGLQRVRRMVGVWAFAYACLHLSTYLVFDQLCYSNSTCQWHDIGVDFTRRPFIYMGLIAFLLLLVLAVTSTNGWIRRLGKRWTTIHRAIYVAAFAAVIHYKWGQKSDFRLPFTYLGVLVALMGARVVLTVRKRRSAALARARRGSDRPTDRA
jgi:sulfoxide reductase heme-binding subunit YedZ